MFLWDEAKRRANLRKHGIDFVDAERIFGGFTLTAEDVREAYGERFPDSRASGRSGVAHTERGEDIRIIYIRKAMKHEARFYLSQIVD